MKLNIKSVIKNKLFQYKGGGYDGCHWEWNWFLFDDKGRFHNIATSGRNGIGTLSEAIDKINENEPYVYKLNETGINEFQTECDEMSVRYISELVNKAYGHDIIELTCNICGNKTNPDYMYSTGYHGNGGVGIVETDFVCGDCHCSYSCGCCGEFQGYYDSEYWATVEKTVEDLKDKHSVKDIKREYKSQDERCGPYCEYCMTSQVDEALTKKTK